jgi:hypothetical protein
MPSVKNDVHGVFIVMNQAAVDLANHGAVASVSTDIDVEAADGEDQFPLKTTDLVYGPFAAVNGAGWDLINAGIAVQACSVKDANTLTLRTTNPSAAGIDPASIAANALKFLVFRP